MQQPLQFSRVPPTGPYQSSLWCGQTPFHSSGNFWLTTCIRAMAGRSGENFSGVFVGKHSTSSVSLGMNYKGHLLPNVWHQEMEFAGMCLFQPVKVRGKTVQSHSDNTWNCSGGGLGLLLCAITQLAVKFRISVLTHAVRPEVQYSCTTRKLC